MKNATIEDVKKAQETGKLEENVMYYCCGYKVHGKRMSQGVATVNPPWVIAEKADGELWFVEPHTLRPIPKGPAQMPKKRRRKPVKGTRPETIVPMSEDIVLKVGDRVVFGDKTRGVLLDSDRTTTPYETKRGWHYKDGKFNLDTEVDHITHVIRPCTPPAPQYDPKDVAFKSNEKCQAQKDFEAGRWVAYVADEEGCCPKWAENERVKVILSYREHNDDNCAHLGSLWGWGFGGGIVAYRKAR